MKKLLLVMLLMAAMPAMSQYTGLYNLSGCVVDAETGKPLPGATVTNLRHSVQTDNDGSYTITYHTYDSDLRLYVSHQGYITDTFSLAPELVRLRPLPKGSIQAQNKQGRPKVGVVLSGGGAKGVAHISALRAIERAGIPIDYICGTSMGSLIGGLYATGWSCDELDSLVRNQDWLTLLTDRPKPENLDLDIRQLQTVYPLWHAFTGGHRNEGAGVIRGLNLDRLFEQMLDGYLDSISFDSLPIPFACVATDVVTNTEVDFRSGYLKKAMRASMSIPGVFSPVRMGERVLVDGGLRNNYPADLARQMGADIIIGVTVQGDTLTADDITSAIDVFMQVIDVNCKNKYNDNIAMSDLVMKVDVKGYSAASFTASSIDTLLRRGAEEAERHWDDLLALRRRHQIDSIPRPDRHHAGMPTGLRTSGLSPLAESPIVGVTFRFDNEETGALQVGALLPFQLAGLPMELYAHLRLGKRIQFSAEHRLFPHGITSPSLAYSFRRNDIDIYSEGIRTYNLKYLQHTLELLPVNSTFRRWRLRAGLRFDYYDFFSPLLSASTTAIHLYNHHLLSYFLKAEINTENHPYLPSNGLNMLASYVYHTDNLLGYDGTHGISEIKALWSLTVSPTERLTVRPAFYGRILLHSGDIPLTLSNALGSPQQIVEQQIFFPGIHSLTYAERSLLAAKLRLQISISRNHYLLIDAAAARHTLNFDQLLSDTPNLYGASLGYCYYTFLGPIEAMIGYSSQAPGLNFYLNIGHRF